MTIKYSSYSMTKRLLALVVLAIFFVCVIIIRLFYLQIINGYTLVSKGLTQWLRDLPLTAVRGTITDRNGVVLASSYTTYDVYVRPADVEDDEGVASVLSEILELDYDEVLEKVQSRSYSEIKIASDIEKSVVQLILSDFKSGIFFTSDTVRDYSYDEMLCQILGFVGSDNSGQSGLELYYNALLSGTDGVSLVEADLTGSTLSNSLTYYADPIDGLNLTLTIDFRIQSAVEEIMQNAMATTGASSVSCLVTNPNTGEILSVCTLPSYNLNDVPRDDSTALNTLSRATTITDTFEPGSTFKAIVCAIALEEGITTKHNYFYCPGYRIINGVQINCASRNGHGSISLETGLMKSCNCVFMDLILKIGAEKFYEYLEKLGLTGTLGIDFPGETAAVLMPLSSVTDPDLARMGFGQSIALSALEMVSAFSAVINGGTVYQPYLVKSISNSEEIVYQKTVTAISKVFSASTCETMKEMLFAVVDSGGGKNAGVSGYTIGGKTGTAQKYENGTIAQGKYIASFIGFAPYDEPEYVVYVIVDEPQGAYYGGVVAAPIASEIFAKIFEIENMSSTLEEEQKTEFTLPTFIGMTLTQAVTEITKLGLQYLIQGDGDYVTNQVSAPGTMVSENDIVLLIFD